MSKEKRHELHDLISDYVTSREELSGLLLLQEAKRKVTEEELAVQRLAFSIEVPLIVVLTKCDKLNQKELSKSLKERSAEFNLLKDDLVLTGEKRPIEELWKRIELVA